jgi:hypothetical protein
MTSITRIDRAINTLRQALTDRAAEGNRVSPHGAPAAGKLDKRARSRQVQERIKKGLAGLDLTTAADQERGVSIFLENVLANEFGTELLNDPAFHNLMADVRHAMLSDENTQKDLLNMLQQLQG